MHVWRDRLARWLTPLARRCPLSPNAITGIALVINLCAAFLFTQGGGAPLLFLAAMGLLAVGGLADAFDGIVARAQGKSTSFGDFLDHVADRISDTVLAAGWMIGSGVRSHLTLAAVFLIMLNGYAGTQIEATWKERSYEGMGRGEFVLAMVVFPIASFILFANGWQSVRLGGFSIPEWMTLLLLLFALMATAQRVALAARLDRE